LAAVISAAAAAVHVLLPAPMHDRVPLAAFYPAFILSAAIAGFGPGALVVLVGAVAAASAARGFDEPAGAAALLVFTLAGLMTSGLFEAMHRRSRRERRLRLDAQRRGTRADYLQQLTSALSRAGTLADVIEACVLEATHSLGAAAGAIAVPDGRFVELAHAVGFAEELAIGWRRRSLDVQTPFSDAVGGMTIALESRKARWTRYPQLAGADLFRDHEAIAVAPLHGRGGASAALAVALLKPHDWTVDERELLAEISRRAAQAMARARAYESVERARADAEEHRTRADQELAERQKAQEALRDSEARYRALAARTSRLHALTAALSEAVTVEAVGRAVIRQGRVVAGAQSGSVALLVDEGAEFSTLYAEDDASPEASARFPAEPGFYSTEVVRARQPVFIGSFAEWQRRCWRSAAQAGDGGYVSAAALPLVADGAAIGVLAFHFTAPLNFDENYRRLLISVAQHCSQALDRARLYEAEQRARADAEAANRSKDEFLSTLSHELRTPLNAILGWASMMRAGALDATRTARATQAIYDNAIRQAKLVEDLLDVSRIIAGRVALDVAEVDLGETIRGAVETILPTSDSKGVSIHLGPQLPVAVMGDGRRIEQVFLNLLSNAVKFTPAGGRVDIAVAVGDTTVDVRLSDTGIGIDPAFLPHAFDRFRQADSQPTRTHAGLGLGLSIANHLAKAHGGGIRVHSDGPGRGTTSIVTLPLAAVGVESRPSSAPAHAAGAVPGQGVPHLAGVRVLVVDDEPDAREMMAAALEHCGAAVTTAPSAAAAMQILETTAQDVLLSDIGMPGEDGYALIRKVRGMPSRRIAAIPAAAVTAYAREDQRQSALAAGFQVHVPKPLDPEQLVQIVARLSRAATVADQPG
jgi:signal transduction histidine kinase/CheY-like chemotaxis protein